AETGAVPAARTGGGVGPGTGRNIGGRVDPAGSGDEAVDYSRPFRPQEVTRRAQVIAKPEPAYTAAARKFHVQGTVSVRAVLNASGEVERVIPITGLPHGLTQVAVEAARKIKFVPAVKDGRNVSQWVTIQYNFNIY
ncbi:MAG TPA: energy transducer TonB, partial [Pyrinomonadaceae bacterium]